MRRLFHFTATIVMVLALLDTHEVEAASVAYGYDPLGRLATALYDDGLCIIYVYDANGNRTSWTNAAPPSSPPLWGSQNWGGFNWGNAPQLPVWGTGVWGCFTWTQQSH